MKGREDDPGIPPPIIADEVPYPPIALGVLELLLEVEEANANGERKGGCWEEDVLEEGWGEEMLAFHECVDTIVYR